MMNRQSFATWFFLTGLVATSGWAETITAESLLNEMTDLGRLTRLSSPSYITRQSSSYDRKSKSPKEDWFANADRGQFLRTEDNAGRKEYVMMDAAGPGAIVRIWSANPTGTLRVYLDGSDRPAIESAMSDLLGGEYPHIPVPLAGKRAAGWNLYFPIPYARHCKVTSDEGGFYYHVNYRTYEPGTQVESLTPAALEQMSDKTARVASSLASPRQADIATGRSTTKRFNVSLGAGSKKSIRRLTGPNAITQFSVRLSAEDIAAAARSTILTITCDGEQTVACPLGDFFGAAPGLPAYEGLPMGITDEEQPELWCHWQMPFATQAEIALENVGQQKIQLAGTTGLAPYDWSDRSLLFHAKWRTERDIPTRPFVDWPHLECTGKGRFVGSTLYLINPVKNWWGEGDEKIYVDGETFPSHFGTGTEDYYGYAWGSPEIFTHAYHSQPRCDGPVTYGNVSLNRFHVIDDIPFTRSFKFDIENWHSVENVKVTRAAVSYWYARPGGTDFFKPIKPEEAVVIDVPPIGVPGVLEGEDMQIIQIDGGSMPQGDDPRYSGHTYLRWHPGRIGGKLTFAFQLPEAREKKVSVRLARASDFGKVQLYVNEQAAGDPIECCVGDPTSEVELGTFALKKGQNTLIAEIVAASRTKPDEFVFGLDYLRLE